MRILVTGTPGVGKTTVAKLMANRLGIPYIDINAAILASGRATRIHELDTNIIDPEEAASYLSLLLKDRRDYVGDTVAVNVVPKDLVDWVIVLRTHPNVIMSRLRLRGWAPCKVAENTLAELVGSSLAMALGHFGLERIIEVDSTNREPHDVVDTIIDLLNSGRPVVGSVDWLESVDTDFLSDLERILSLCT